MPIKGGPDAKSRLTSGIEAGSAASDLATAIAADSVSAALSAPSVAKVIAVLGMPHRGMPDREMPDDGMPDDEAWVREAGAQVVRQSGQGLIDAIGAGIHAADPGLPCAVLLADVPALRPEELEDALHAVATALGMSESDATRPLGEETLTPEADPDEHPSQAFVPDHSGTGTVLLAALRPSGLTPAFGPDSAWLHAQTGAQRLPGPWPSLRHDVDTPEDLAAVQELGLGPYTRQCLEKLAPSAVNLSMKDS